MAHTRINDFVRWFADSPHVANQWGASSDDWINDPDRASRCDQAAEHGADGSTHAERIQDQREAFRHWIRDRRHHDYPYFVEAVTAHFDQLEAFHEDKGSLHSSVN